MKKLIYLSLIFLLSPLAANAGRFSWVCQDPFSETSVNMKERDIERVKRTGYGRYLDLRGANFEGAYLKGANLEGADLRGASLRNANLKRANLKNTNLAHADLRGTKLAYANINTTNFHNAKMTLGIIYGLDKYNAQQLLGLALKTNQPR